MTDERDERSQVLLDRRRKLEELRAAGIELSRGTVYVTLDRLERKGLVTSWFDDPTPQRGGKATRCFRITPDGMAELRAAQRRVDRLRAGTVLQKNKP